MRTVASVAIIGACMTWALSAWSQESFSLQGNWWQEPAQRTRHTTLVASFDRTDDNDADFARGMGLSGGQRMDADVPGLHGSATQISDRSGLVYFPGGSNFQARHGTLRLQVKGEVWADPTPHWIFDAAALNPELDPVTNTRARYRTSVQIGGGKLSLLLIRNRDEWAEDTELARLDLDTGPISTNEWHSVVASWDRDSSTGWITLDGRGVSGPIEFPELVRASHAIFLGVGAGSTDLNGAAPAGTAFDDFVLYDLSLPVLESQPLNQLAAEDVELLPRAEAAARKTLNQLADLQQGGGWNWAYSWPALISLNLEDPTRMWPNDFLVNTDKGNSTTMVAQDFSYGYDVLGDYRFMDVITNTADTLLAAQYPGGYWTHQYYIRPGGLVGAYPEHIKFQDTVQSYPLFFLAYAYRLTGDQRYMDAMMKSGEFYITAQNPNGSFPHHFNLEKGIGETAIGLPQGGELNDLAANDAMDVMAFMYHMTGEAKYVEALKRIADWLIEAQGKDIPLWADQYDRDNNPVWARAFEPPSYAEAGTESALNALREAYRFSGDERYLNAMKKTLTWMQDNLPDGAMAYYLELGTARPIAAWDKRIYYLDQPEDVAYLQTVPIGSWELEKHPILATATTYVRSAAAPDMSPPTPQSALQGLPGWRSRAQQVLDAQNDAGLWISHDVGLGKIGDVAYAVQWQVRTVLGYIEQARMALGEIPAERRGQGDPRRTAYPYSDWYDVDWQANAQ